MPRSERGHNCATVAPQNLRSLRKPSCMVVQMNTDGQFKVQRFNDSMIQLLLRFAFATPRFELARWKPPYRGSDGPGRLNGGKAMSRTIQAGTSSGTAEGLPSRSRNLLIAVGMRNRREAAW